MSPNFRFPPRPGDRLLAPLAAAERAGRALARALRDRRFPGPSAVARPGAVAEPAAPAAGIVVLPALPWDFRHQRPQQLAAALAAEGHPVLYVDAFARGLLQPRRRLVRLGERLDRLVLPHGRNIDPFRRAIPPAEAARLVDEVAAGVTGPVALVLAQLPAWLPVARRLRERLGCSLLYDRLDHHAGFPGVPPEVTEWERELIACSDLVTASSPQLAEGLATAKRVELLPNAVALEDFPFRAVAPRRPPDSLRVGYVGALHEWFDAPAVAAAAAARPGWRFELAGRVEADAVTALARHPNVHLHGEIPYRRVAAFLAELDVSLVPFLDQPLTRAVDPVKLYESLAVGVPVVARRLPGVAAWPEPFVLGYATGQDLAGAIARAAAEDTEEVRRRRRRLAAENTWRQRARVLARLFATNPAGHP